ncbi:RPA-related protein RADX [Stigmatopora nigra]
MDGTASTSTDTPPPPSLLKKTLDHVSQNWFNKSTARQTTESVAVLAIQRYVCQVKENEPCESYNYDITITDGVWRAKCFLPPCLNHLVHSNTLKTGSEVIINKYSFVYDAHNVHNGYTRIDDLRCVSEKSPLLCNIKDVNSLPQWHHTDAQKSRSLEMDSPLMVNRKHYLPLWNTEFPEGDIWDCPVKPPHLPVAPSDPGVMVALSDLGVNAKRVISIMDLEYTFISVGKRLPILVKILHKSRLRYYGKPNTKIEYPYQAYFEVADKTGIMSLVLWNELCPQYYKSFHVGTVLYIEDYALKNSYRNRSRPKMDQYQLESFNNTEICLNARFPAAIITIIPDDLVDPQWELPELTHRFTSRSAMSTLPNNSVCDVMAFVTFVGRVERIKSATDTAPEKHWLFRWVHAVDGSSELPFILELFSSSQPNMFDKIIPMTFVMCTQMRVCHVEGSLPYLTTSCETEIFISGHHKGQPYLKDPTVRKVVRWLKAIREEVVHREVVLGGHYRYPHPPRTFPKPGAGTPEQFSIINLPDLRKAIEAMQYREHKMFAIQGQIMTVRYVEKKSVSKPQDGAAQTAVDISTGEQTATEVHVETGGSQPGRKRTRKTRNLEPPVDSMPAKRPHTEAEDDSQSGKQTLQQPNEGSSALYWENSSWSSARLEIYGHLRHGTLHEGSVAQDFEINDVEAIMQWCNLQPNKWTPEQFAYTLPETVYPGYYQVTILGMDEIMAADVVFLPVEHANDPRGVGLSWVKHDNSMLSCLSSGFICQDEAKHRKPGEIVASTSELEKTRLIFILDICHLGREKKEVLIRKVYTLNEIPHS